MTQLKTGFEGPEKLLEVWFTPNPEKELGLRAVSLDVWVELLKLVKCEVLSVLRKFEVDAFLLSESSMFVFQSKLILKTCGTTTLLNCLDELLRIAKDVAGLSGHVDYVFYRTSRKSFMFPQCQLFPHTTWEDEVGFLGKYFEDGSAYVVGRTNGDHWYCYVWEDDVHTDFEYTDESCEDESCPSPVSVSSSKVTKSYNFSVISNSSANESFETHSKLQSSTLAIQSAFEKDEDDSVIYECDSTCASTLGKDHSLFLNPPYPKYGILQNHKIMKPQISSTKGLTWPDHTLEILMTSLNQSRAKMFFKDNAYNEDGTMKVTKMLQSIYPDAVIDDYAFDPCGYSCNALVENQGYFTVHVTPESHCSYASFETNIPAFVNVFMNSSKDEVSPLSTQELFDSLESISRTSYVDIVRKIVDIFEPGKFTVTLFKERTPRNNELIDSDSGYSHTSSPAKKNDLTHSRISNHDDYLEIGHIIDKYERKEKILYEFDQYDLLFFHYTRNILFSFGSKTKLIDLSLGIDKCDVDKLLDLDGLNLMSSEDVSFDGDKESSSVVKPIRKRKKLFLMRTNSAL